jgi:hypothetical protein
MHGRLQAQCHQRHDVHHRREQKLALVLPAPVLLEQLVQPTRVEDTYRV